MRSYKDADKLLSSLENSYFAACKWEEEAKDEEIKTRANSAKVTFLECYLRTKEMPDADVEEVRHGEWLENGANYKCSRCGNTEPYYTDSYCRVCGAKMERGKNGTN